MNYAMEDTQNTSPGDVPPAQAAKLAPRKGPDAQSTTKRFVLPLHGLTASHFQGCIPESPILILRSIHPVSKQS